MNPFENSPQQPKQVPDQEVLRELTENESQLLTAIEDGFRLKGAFLMPDSMVALKQSLVHAMEIKIPALTFQGSVCDARSGVRVTLPVTFEIRFQNGFNVLNTESMVFLNGTAVFNPILRRDDVVFQTPVYFKDYHAAEARRAEERNKPKPPPTEEENIAEIDKKWRSKLKTESNDFRLLVTKLAKLEGKAGSKVGTLRELDRGNYREIQNYNNEYMVKIQDGGVYLEIYRLIKDENGVAQGDFFAGYDMSSDQFCSQDIAYFNSKIQELGIDFQFSISANSTN
jgi:hypothetical protein